MALPVQSERYNQYASECLRLAGKASSAHEKNLLLQMAEAWRRLAERATPCEESRSD